MRHGFCHLDRVGLSHRHIVIFRALCSLGCGRKLFVGTQELGGHGCVPERGDVEVLGLVS